VKLIQFIKDHFFIYGFLCLIWFIIRTGSKPSRTQYPCQRVAALNAHLWLSTYIVPIFGIIEIDRLKVNIKTFLFIFLIFIGVYGYMNLNVFNKDELTLENFQLEPMESAEPDSSIIYAVTNTNGKYKGIERLMALMYEHNQPFYKSLKNGNLYGPDGFFDHEDIVIIKVNSQWDERGGTNTDLVKSIIEAIVNHPDGWSGEIIVADNGQAQYGASGKGGSLDWLKNNAQNHSQSIQDVVDLFTKYNVSTYLWDTITTNVVQEYAEGDFEDGYVVQTNVFEITRTIVSYPKFTTSFGTRISFKYGVYNSETEGYDTNRLKLVNVPVLKTHMIYGVTGAVKHYMGIPSDKLTAALGYRIHNGIGRGSMGTLMAQTRVPTLNIMDAIYVNAKPKDGPSTSYMDSKKVNVIAASTDPFALDYWASKNILCKICEKNGGNTSTLDPDNTRKGEFGDWLSISINELIEAGYNFTIDPNEITVFID